MYYVDKVFGKSKEYIHVQCTTPRQTLSKLNKVFRITLAEVLTVKFPDLI